MSTGRRFHAYIMGNGTPVSLDIFISFLDNDKLGWTVTFEVDWETLIPRLDFEHLADIAPAINAALGESNLFESTTHEIQVVVSDWLSTVHGWVARLID